MRVKRILSVAATIAVLVALVRLFVAVGEEQRISVPEDKLAAAIGRYKRAQELRTATGARLKQLRAELRNVSGEEEEEGPPPVPWEARALPAKAPDLNEGVTDIGLAARLDEVPTLYRSRDYRGAITRAEALLQKDAPDNIELRRIIVRASCIENDPKKARQYLAELPESEHELLLEHCKTYGAALE